MRIRTITTGFNLELPLREEQIKKIADFTNRCKRTFEAEGYTVQTVRIATQPWEEYFESKTQILALVKALEGFTQTYHIDYWSIGTTKNLTLIPILYDLIENTSKMFCTVLISDDKQIHYAGARKTAHVIRKVAQLEGGFANLRFAALFNTKPGSPFYPASYHEGPTSFALGTENSDMVYKAFSQARDIEKAKLTLSTMLTKEFKKIERLAEHISIQERIQYDGIDVSIATSIDPEESIAYAFEKLGLGKFGEAGTLAVARAVTATLRKLDVKKCGYSGLMLPVLEDYGLAMRNSEGSYNLANLLLYSAACGTGLDTIPLPGDVSEEKLYALLLDIASLSIELNKPLSARLMPIPGKRAGEMTDFEFEYFVNTKIMRI